MSSDIAITGASGFLGSHLLGKLAEEGDTVRAIVRRDAAADMVAAAGAVPVKVDLFDEDGLTRAMSGVAVLYHVAGVNETCPRDVTAMDRVNVDGTMSVIRAAAAAGVGRVVYTSSAAAIGEEAGMIGTEATVHSGTYVSPYARSKHRAEVAALEQAAASGVDLVVVNPASVQGPGRSGGSARILLYALRSRRPVLVHTMISLVDIEDCTAGHIAAASRGRTGQRYLLSGATVSVADAVDLAAATTGRVVAPRWIGAGTLRSVGKTAAWLMHMVRPHSGICPALIETLLHGHRFDGSRAERDLALRYTPIEDTFARTIQWFEEQGLIGGS